MQKENCNLNDPDLIIFFIIMFIFGLMGEVAYNINMMNQYFNNKFNFNQDFLINEIYLFLLIIPFPITMLINKIESISQNNKINKKYKLFEELLNDKLLTFLLNDQEAKKKYSVLEKTILLRIQELKKENKISNKFKLYDKFLFELMDYHRIKEKTLQLQIIKEKAAESQKILNSQEEKEALELLNKAKINR